MPQRIKCDDVGHRKGYIEITPGIHDGCVNLETWSVREEIDLASRDVRDDNTVQRPRQHCCVRHSS